MTSTAIYNDVGHAASALADCLRDKQHILVITHVNPDGDAIGSLAGFGLALEALGHRVTLLAPTRPPRFLRNVPAFERIQNFGDDRRLPEDVDLVMLVDTGDVGRIGRVWTEAME